MPNPFLNASILEFLELVLADDQDNIIGTDVLNTSLQEIKTAIQNLSLGDTVDQASIIAALENLDSNFGNAIFRVDDLFYNLGANSLKTDQSAQDSSIAANASDISNLQSQVGGHANQLAVLEDVGYTLKDGYVEFYFNTSKVSGGVLGDLHFVVGAWEESTQYGGITAELELSGGNITDRSPSTNVVFYYKEGKTYFKVDLNTTLGEQGTTTARVALENVPGFGVNYFLGLGSQNNPMISDVTFEQIFLSLQEFNLTNSPDDMQFQGRFKVYSAEPENVRCAFRWGDPGDGQNPLSTFTVITPS